MKQRYYAAALYTALGLVAGLFYRGDRELSSERQSGYVLSLLC